MSSTNFCLSIPELVEQIVLNLSSLADVSSLSRCDRTCHEMVMPILFQNISIYLEEATAIADVLKKNPHICCRCRSFTLKGIKGGTLPGYGSHFRALFDDLAQVLKTLAYQANVKVVSWCWGTISTVHSMPSVPSSVWYALRRLSSSLEQLNLFISRSDPYHWVSS